VSDFDQDGSFPNGSGSLNPIALIVPAIVLLAAVVLFSRRSSGGNAVEEVGKAASKAGKQTGRKGGSASRRAMLTLAINALENDAARRAVIMGLKLVRSRS